MVASSLKLIEYRTEDGAVFELKVSPAVAAALSSNGGRLKEVTFTDLGNGQFELTEERIRKRPEVEPKPGCWEGPRFPFNRFLGEHRPGWNGGPSIDERGRCGLCHGAQLSAGEYCLSCERCGRDRAIPLPPEQARRRAPKDGRLRGGCQGKR